MFQLKLLTKFICIFVEFITYLIFTPTLGPSMEPVDDRVICEPPLPAVPFISACCSAEYLLPKIPPAFFHCSASTASSVASHG